MITHNPSPAHANRYPIFHCCCAKFLLVDPFRQIKVGGVAKQFNGDVEIIYGQSMADEVISQHILSGPPIQFRKIDAQFSGN